MSESDNLPQVIAALKEYQMKFDIAIGSAADELSKQLAGIAMRQIQGDRKSAGYPAVSGKPPMNVTGNLRRSIKGKSSRVGFGIYTAEAGAYMVYARAVELGGAPTWTNGQHFPYMQPALEQFRRSTVIQNTIAKHLRRVQ
jgi:hypothetical protein